MVPVRRATEGLVAVVAVLAAITAALSPASPTGRPAVDAAIVAVGVAATVFIGALAPWWSVAVLAGVAMAIAIDPILIAVAAAALIAALATGARPPSHPVVLAVSIALSANVLARAEFDAFLGSTALIGITAGALVLLLGLSRQRRTVRRATLGIAGALAALGVVAVAGFGYAAASAREDLAAGVRYAEQAVSALESGDFDRAEADFASAADVLERAHAELDAPWAAPASFVPVLAQHRDAVVDMSDAGYVGAAEVAAAIEQIDLDSLRAVGGRIDLAAIAALREPFTRVHDALDRLSAAVDEARSPWLVNRARLELDDFEVSVADHLPSLENAIAATELAPRMLGADRPQTYLVLFTTPSESRGLGGFIGNYAELTIDDGQLGLSGFGRAQDLDRQVAEAGARLEGPEGFLDRYGRFGFADETTGLVGNASFRNLTMTPHFPWVGEVATDLYAQATGKTVDGVIAVDPFVVAAMLDYTGPVELTTLDRQLDASNAAAFLLRDQYVVAEDIDQRVDALAEAAERTFRAVLSSSLPDPATLAEDLGPLASDRRLLIWSPDEAEEELFRNANVAGELPAHGGADGWSVSVTNGGGNKIDTFLERAASYESQVDPATGETAATLRFELRNTAPAEGLPRYVIGNQVGLPSGTNRLYVSFYSPLALTEAQLDGVATGVEVSAEQGWNVYSKFVDIPPGGLATFELTLAGTVVPGAELVTWEQPMATPVAPLDGT